MYVFLVTTCSASENIEINEIRTHKYERTLKCEYICTKIYVQIHIIAHKS